MSSDIIIGDCLFCVALALVHILNSGVGGGGYGGKSRILNWKLYQNIGNCLYSLSCRFNGSKGKGCLWYLLPPNWHRTNLRSHRENTGNF